MKLSDRIKKIRKKNKFSQLEFSKSLGVSRSHISNIETGAVKPSEHLLKLLCATWSIDENWLKTGKEKIMQEAESQSCSEVKKMLLEAAVMDLDDALSGIGIALGEAKASMQRVRNLMNNLHVYGTANIEWEHNHD